MRGWNKIFHANRNQKKAGVAILISGKIDFKIKNVTRDNEGHYIMIKGSIQEEVASVRNKPHESKMHAVKMCAGCGGRNKHHTLLN